MKSLLPSRKSQHFAAGTGRSSLEGNESRPTNAVEPASANKPWSRCGVGRPCLLACIVRGVRAAAFCVQR